MTVQRQSACLFAVILGCLALYACYPRIPVYLHADLSANPIDSVFIFTAFSSCTDSTDSTDYHQHAVLEAKRCLEERGYTVSCADPDNANRRLFARNSMATSIQLDWIDSLNGNERGYVMVLELQTADSGWFFEEYIDVKVYGYLFDTRSRSLVWQDQGEGEVTEYPGGLIGALNPIELGRGVELAVQNLMMSFPMRGKRFRSTSLSTPSPMDPSVSNNDDH